MTDYDEEQRSEIEALQSIYPDELTVMETRPSHRFTISVKTADYEDNGTQGAYCLLSFTFVDKYPDVPPVISVDEMLNSTDNDAEVLASHLVALAEENVGMVMVFTLVSAAQEWLTNRSEEIENVRREKLEREVKEREAAEQRKLEGTQVTVESFLAWKAQFDAERALLKKNQKESFISKKLTGRELFERDTTMYDSDIKFLQEGEDVKVDESLFQELDDLELEDELFDDNKS